MKIVSAIWKTLNLLMAIFFALSVFIDAFPPISAPGMAIYGAAAVVCVFAIRDTNLPVLPMMIGAITLIWMVKLAPHVIGKVRFEELFVLSDREGRQVDMARRMLCLSIVVFWMGLASYVFWRQDTAKG